MIGGETGIRTLGTRKGSTVFETAPFDHSGTSPRGSGGGRLMCLWGRGKRDLRGMTDGCDDQSARGFALSVFAKGLG